ncbi:TetR/AcrR family transcriptional regulator [Actinomadura logoneensis]|uniref:TetR/AcrR family transcriptional regulator n=1 Tax=Actinomadura logoneensis TaxID=2293572 RepID=A0A372JLZ5_9ACTN|nr:TetR/AcrR family transcriptional regulator [Actinomadura logoneensis]RFU40854.1 TetR/AcrR family transcriptional regulator [Actinomadura logoneensis]
MTSNRHNRMDEQTVLDAARDCVLAVGVRRTTLTDIARRAGVSRMTLYRRWPDVRTIVADLMTREWTAVGTAVRPSTTGAGTGGAGTGGGGATAREALMDGLVTGVAALRDHPLMRKILDVDPELLLPYLLDRLGASQSAFLEIFEEALAAGHADGSIRAGDTARQARALLLVVQSFALSGRTVADPADPALTPEAFDTELRTILERTLAP